MGSIQFKRCGPILIWMLLSLFACCEAFAGGGPENVLVVVNADSPSSTMIANYYVSLRKIPARNVVYLDKIPDQEIIPLDSFLKLILGPALKQLEERKLANIDYVVYSADFPTSVNITPIVNKLVEEAAKRKVKFKTAVFAPSASINSLTYFFPHALAWQKGVGGEKILGLANNQYFRKPSSQVLREPFVGSLQGEFLRSINAFSSEKDSPHFISAVSALEKMGNQNPQQMAVFYWLAKFAAKSGDADAASRWITRAMALGLSQRDLVQQDRDFKSVSDPLFKGLIKRMGNDGNTYAASRGFRQFYRWGPNGMINRTPGQADQYLLSTVLAVTRNGGNTELEAVRQLRRSIAADFSKPKGAFYFTDTSDVRSKARIKLFSDATEALKRRGYPSRIVKSTMPKNAVDALGITSGASTFDLARSNCRPLPGAICENLTSYGGRLSVVRGQTKLSEFLRFGAAGSSGTVTEPLALWQKFPHPMIHAHYVRGCSLAESFYQSLSGPYQTLIVGDALCQPFATQPIISVTGIKPGEEVSDEARTLELDDSKSPLRASAMELYIDGGLIRRFNELRPLSLDIQSLADGYHELRLVFVGANRAETTGRTIIPFMVNRNNRKCSLTASAETLKLEDEVSLSFSCDGADSIRIMHNQRIIHQSNKDTGDVKISGSVLGRGPVTIQAIATMPDSAQVSSTPVQLRVIGKISSTRRLTVDGKK